MPNFMPGKIYFSGIIAAVFLLSPLALQAQTIAPKTAGVEESKTQSGPEAKAFAASEDKAAPSKKAVSVSPVTFELTANRGEVFTNQLKISNVGTEPLAIAMEAEDFTTVGEGGEVVVKPAEDTSFSLAKWFTMEPKNFALAPGEEKIVTFTISVPLDAEPGGHYATIMAAAQGAIVNTTGVAFVQKTGSLILLSVAGEVKEQMVVNYLGAPFLNEYGPIPFKIRFENLGSIHVKPKGFVSITDSFDKKLVDIPFSQHNIFPGKARVVETSWDTKYLFGKYTATLVGSYGLGNTPFTAFTTFWVVPWKIVGGSAIGLILIVWIFWKMRRRLKLALRALIKGR